MIQEPASVGGAVSVANRVVARCGETARRRVGPRTEAVDALVRHSESVGLAGAPGALGRDDRGRRKPSFVQSDAALTPVPATDDVGDGSGNTGRGERGELLTVVAHRHRMGRETRRLYGGERRLSGWAETCDPKMCDPGSGTEIRKRSVWLDAHRTDLRRSLA